MKQPTPQTIDPQEIHKFSEQSNDWWNETGSFKPLHQMNPTRIEYIKTRTLEQFETGSLEGLRFLDVGCGGGLLCEPISRLGAKVTGLDASAKAIEVALSHAQAQELPITYVNQTPESFNPETLFDVVTALEIVEHVANLEGFIKTVTNFVRPGGLIFFSTLNRTLKSLLLAKIGAEYILRMIPKDTHQWSKFVKPSELDCLLTKNAVSLKDLKGLIYTPLSSTWRLSDNVDVNYICVGERGGAAPRANPSTPIAR